MSYACNTYMRNNNYVVVRTLHYFYAVIVIVRVGFLLEAELSSNIIRFYEYPYNVYTINADVANVLFLSFTQQ